MPYEILFTQDPQATLVEFLNKKGYSKVFLIADENTKLHCLPIFDQKLIKQITVFTIKPGEEQKNLNTCVAIWQAMTDAQLDRKAVVINLGGGVIGDMGGFCAATYKRGIDFIQIPTTLLSQVDASVGGKLGIDFANYKNHIGVFNEPAAVIISSVFLNSLDIREQKSGFAEVIKHALIADKNAWDYITSQKKGFVFEWNNIIPHSVNIKRNITTQDPTEKGLRKVLNFGHTLGHAVESFFLEKGNRILHGEAIAIGMIMEAYLSFSGNFISDKDLIEIQKYILSIYSYIKIPESATQEIIKLTKHDKKNEQGHVLFSLLEKIGEANYNKIISDEQMKKAINYYNTLCV